MVTQPNSNGSSDKIAEAESVRQYLAAIIHDAEDQAEIVAAFLQSQGLKPHSRIDRSKSSTAIPTGPAADFLLELDAALRLRIWELAGLMPDLNLDLPSAGQALVDAADRAVAPAHDSELARKLPKAVFRTHLLKISRSANETLKVPVALPTAGDGNLLLDQLADLLWEHRDLFENTN